MSSTPDISIRVVDDGRRAEIHLPPECDAGHLTPALLSIIAADAGVQITADVERRLAEIVRDYKAAPQDLVADIAHAVEPTHGTDGVWTWEQKFDPGAAPTTTVVDGHRTDHRASHVLNVVPGASIARIVPPGDGVDGRDVRGAVLPARQGRAPNIRPGVGLQLRADGSVVATVDGVLEVSGGVASVSPLLEIKGSVDFSTGNVDFKGDVQIADGIRDGFHISATGSITVKGIIEGAQIVSGGNLTCPRGVASARRAIIDVGGDIDIGYLRNVSAIVRGNLTCRGELEHSDTIVGGECRCESGSVIGGRLRLTGPATIGTIGSPGWAPTLICVGELPIVAMALRRLDDDLALLQEAIVAKGEAALHLKSRAAGQSASAREQLTELQYELSELRAKAATAGTERSRLQEAMRRGGGAELRVVRIVHPKTKLQHGGAAFEFEKELKGPLTFLLDAGGAILVRISTQAPRPITEFAHAVPASSTAPAAPLRKSA